MNDFDKALCLDTMRTLGGFRAAWEDKEGNDDHGRGQGGVTQIVTRGKGRVDP